MILTLNKPEYEYLINAKYFDRKIIDQLSKSLFIEKFRYMLDLPKEIMEELRIKLEDRLQSVGFDENYNLTEEGKMVEDLIDRFFVS